MPPPKAKKIDLSSTYPCPCRRQGRLVPIALTEAFGCQRCQQIFVVKQDDPTTIEQLSTSYPYKRTWYWTGHQWSTARRSLGTSYWFFTIGLSLLILMPLVIWLSLAKPDLSLLLWAIAAFLVAVVPAFIAWLALYRE